MCPGANEGDSDSGINKYSKQTKERQKRSDSPEQKKKDLNDNHGKICVYKNKTKIMRLKKK